MTPQKKKVYGFMDDIKNIGTYELAQNYRNAMTTHELAEIQNESERRDEERAALRAEVERRIAEIESLNLKLNTLNAAIAQQPESTQDDITDAYAEIAAARSNDATKV